MRTLVHYPRLFFLFLFVIFYGIMYFFDVENAMLRTVFSVTLAFVLSPRRKEFETQSETKIQITWFLLKEPIILDK